ncbi:class I SAM-dependent methyltransferase [Hydrogenophaga intermedia]|uniref:Uncharacterized protein n=1 Tax=Hydrogenophaga intermedia TaxID=65786 RepID=A0A1L1PFI8_HYDIT|nr:hypothetical protein [Hydrogenophaga intermedia]CDN87514.1 hypothetical protein BN948_01936 [Hydrogenophaga intermedia]
MNDVVTPLIPVAYDGREQALVKHRLLEDYLEKLFLIIGMGSKNGGGSIELCYVDCFAGPWGDPSEDMQSTSIAISLTTLDTCRQKLASMGVYVKIRALYVEARRVEQRQLKKAGCRHQLPTGGRLQETGDRESLCKLHRRSLGSKTQYLAHAGIGRQNAVPCVMVSQPAQVRCVGVRVSHAGILVYERTPCKAHVAWLRLPADSKA